MAYTTIDYLPDLTYSEMGAARSLSFSSYPVPSIGWDYRADVYGSENYAILHDTYQFTAIAGATYDIFSTSFFDPYLLRVYDQDGNTIVANDEGDDGADIYLGDGYYSRDIIFNWVAPYSGTFYVAANWHQGSYYKYYSLSMYENVDTAVPVDIFPPYPLTFSPSDEAMGVAIGTNIVVTFSEAVQRGTGSIVLKTAGGTVVATYDAASSANLSISGSTLTINPTADLSYSTAYVAVFASGSIKDLAGNSYAGTSSYNFTTAANTNVMPTVSVSQAEIAIVEGDTNNPTVLASINLDAPSTGWVVVHYTVRSGSANVNTPSGADVIGSVAGNLTFAPGETSKTLSNTFVWSDTQIEGNEFFWVDFDQIVVGNARFAGGASSLSVKVNVENDDFDSTAPYVTTFTPADESTSTAIDTNIVVTFSEAIARGTGNVVLKTAAGTVVAVYDAASSANLSISGNTLTINPSKDLGIFTTYKVEIGAGAVKDLADNSYAGESDYNFTTQTVDGLYHFFVVAFNAAPGVEYMNQLAEAYNYGLTLKEIVNIFTTKTQFTNVYPVSLTNEQLATQLVSNIVKNSASEQSKAEAVHDIEGALAIGWSRGDVIYQVFGNLAAKPLNDPTWGNTALQFLNQTAVARYYTEVMHQSTTDLPTLRAVVGDVTPYTDVSTPEAIATLIGVELGANDGAGVGDLLGG